MVRPEVTTEAPIGVEGTSAILLAAVDPNGADTDYRYEYGTSPSFGDTIVAEEEAVGSAPTETEEGVVDLEPETTYYYRAVAESQAGIDFGQTRTFTTSKVAIGEADQLDVTYGVHWGHPDDMYDVRGAEMVRGSGASYLRLDLLTNAISQANKETIFRLAAERHIRILPHLGSGKIPNSGAPQNWKATVEDAVRVFGRNGTFWQKYPALASYAPQWWEVWNEPNYIDNGWINNSGQVVINAGVYGELMQQTAQAVHNVDSQAKILGGSLLSVGPVKGKTMRVRAFINGMQSFSGSYDALALHPYAFRADNGQLPTSGNVDEVAARVEGNIEEARNALPDMRPIWITEIGWPVPGPGFPSTEDGGPNDGHPAINQSLQRDLINATFKRIEKNTGSGNEEENVDAVFYYNLQDSPSPAWYHHTGLVSDYDGEGNARYRPAWKAFQTWARYGGNFPRNPKNQHNGHSARPNLLLENATLNSFGNATKYWIRWAKGPADGKEQFEFSTATQGLGQVEEGDVTIQAQIPGLTPKTQYHYRLVAQDDAIPDGEEVPLKTYGPEIGFTTPPSTEAFGSKEQVLHGQPGWAWIGGWVKEGAETPNTGPGIPSGYVNVNFKRDPLEPNPIISQQANVVNGEYDTGFVSGLGTGQWYFRTVFPAQNGWDQSESEWHEFFVHDGVQVIAKHSQKCMDINGVQTQNGAGVMHRQCLNPQTSQNQVFTTEPFGEFLRFRARHSGRCVDVANASTGDGAPIQQYDCHTGGNQLFRQVWWGETPYADYRAQHSGKCLDVTGASTGWAPFQQWSCNGNEQQRFRLEPVDSAPIPTETFWTLDQALHGSPGLVSFHGRLQAGAYPMSGRIVHVEIDNADTPNWDTSGGDITFGIDGNNYYEYRDWRLDPGNWNVRAHFVGNGEFKESYSNTQPITIKRGYLIRGRQSGRCLSLSENKNQNGQAFIIWDCSAVNGNGQVFSFVARGGNWYDLRPNGTNRCLDVAGAGTGDGTNLQLWDCLGDGQTNQHWKREPISGQPGWYALVPRHAQTKCADVKDVKTNNGQRVWQWGCTWAGNQQWDLEGVINP